MRSITMKRLTHTPRLCSPRVNLRSIHSLRPTQYPAAHSVRHYSQPVNKPNFESRKQSVTDRHRIDRQSTEYTSSGTDSSVADRGDVSFDPNKSLDPEQARELAAKGEPADSPNPLEFSPANPAVSDTSREAEGGRNTWSEKSETKGGFFGAKSKATDGKMGNEDKVFKGFDRRKEGQTPTVVPPGSR